MHTISLIIFLVFANFHQCYAIHCLVLRPGFGLTSENCPRLTGSCRVRIDKKSIQWYQYSKLYDRNHFACVMYNEYNGKGRSGCVEKPSGSARCWCSGPNNCNTPKNMKKLYLAFKSMNKTAIERVGYEIESTDIDVYDDGNAEFEENEIVIDEELSLPTMPLIPFDDGTAVERGKHALIEQDQQTSTHSPNMPSIESDITVNEALSDHHSMNSDNMKNLISERQLPSATVLAEIFVSSANDYRTTKIPYRSTKYKSFIENAIHELDMYADDSIDDQEDRVSSMKYHFNSATMSSVSSYTLFVCLFSVILASTLR